MKRYSNRSKLFRHAPKRATKSKRYTSKAYRKYMAYVTMKHMGTSPFATYMFWALNRTGFMRKILNPEAPRKCDAELAYDKDKREYHRKHDYTLTAEQQAEYDKLLVKQAELYKTARILDFETMTKDNSKERAVAAGILAP